MSATIAPATVTSATITPATISFAAIASATTAAAAIQSVLLGIILVVIFAAAPVATAASVAIIKRTRIAEQIQKPAAAKIVTVIITITH